MMKHDFLNDISDFIFISDPPENADIIFIPGGSYPELPEYAARLYKEGYAPLVLPSGRFSIKHCAFLGSRTKKELYGDPYHTEFEFMKDVLIKNGVPSGAILKEDQSQYTQQNAFFSRAVTEQAGLTIKKAIIVCKAFHARRCLTYWQLAYPETDFCVCPVSPDGITKENWFQTEKGVDRAFTRREIARTDNTDMPFVDDPAVIGKWKAWNFIRFKEDFSAEGDPDGYFYWKSVEFFPGGSVTSVYEDEVIEGDDRQTWTKRYILRKFNDSACEYEIRTVDGVEYLIVEWKSGDWRFGGYDTNYYIFVRDE